MKFLLDQQAMLTMHNTGVYEASKYHKGGSTTTTSGWDPETQKRVNSILDRATGLWDGGDLSKVVGFNDVQREAHRQGGLSAGTQTGIEKDVLGIANTPWERSQQKYATDAAINKASAGLSGGLGGSSSLFNQGQINSAGKSAYDANRSAQLTNAHALQGGGAKSLAMIGGAQQQQLQNEADKHLKGLNAIGGLTSGLGGKQSTAVRNGK